MIPVALFFEIFCIMITFFACFRVHYIFARYYHENQTKDIVLLSIIGFCTWIFLMAFGQSEKGTIFILPLILLTGYPYFLAKFIQNYKVLKYSIPLILIHLCLWLYIIGYNIKII